MVNIVQTLSISGAAERRPSSMRSWRVRGFTLVELITVVTIVGVIAALSAPSFAELIRSQRIKSTTNDLLASLSFARSEAVKRNANVTVTAVTIGGTTSWSNGWSVTYVDGGTTVTPRTQPKLEQLTVVANPSSLTAVTFGGGGRVDANGVFTVESVPQSNNATRCVEVRVDGLPREWIERSGNHACSDE